MTTVLLVTAVAIGCLIAGIIAGFVLMNWLFKAAVGKGLGW